MIDINQIESEAAKEVMEEIEMAKKTLRLLNVDLADILASIGD